MASSVARMPPAADADPFRHPAANLNLNLKKVATRHKTRQRKDSHEPASSSSSSPRILDRWAERQARDVITTIERQAHEAELTALSTTSQPVSARAATFHRETSPSPSPSPSSLSECSSSAGNADLRPNVRASSLIQMWREMEADAGGGAAAPPSPGSERKLAGEQSVTEKAAAGRCCVVRVRCRREMEDLVDTMRMERMREVFGLAGLHKVSRFPHRGRIQSMLKLRFLRKDLAMQNQAQPISRKRAPNKLSDRGVTILFLRERFDNLIQNDSGIPAKKRSSTVNAQFPIDSQDPCSTHSADQSSSSTDNNQCQEVISIEGPESLPPESTSPQSRSDDLHVGSQIAELSALHSRTEELNEANQGHNFSSLDSISKDRDERSQILELNSLISTSEYLREGCQSPELSSLQPNEYLKEGCQSPELDLLRLRSEDLCDRNQSPEASWDERNLWVGNLDWQRTIESPNVHSWQSEPEILAGELESYAPQDIVTTGHIWMGDSSRSWRSWEVNSSEYHDYFETFSDNTEIRELLERRRVTTSLESDFCDKMNRVIMRFLRRQGEQYVDENFSEEYGEQPTWRRSYVFNNADQAASGSSLVPSSYLNMHYPDSLQHTSFAHHSSHNLQESENVHDMKKEMARMRQEISDLRKLVKSCMEWQEKVQGSIKDEVSSAVHQSVLVTKTSEGSKRPSGQRDSCCICHEMQVDSLLYRCGHMCACFKCAHELQWSGGACPICRASIVDVVWGYPDT